MPYRLAIPLFGCATISISYFWVTVNIKYSSFGVKIAKFSRKTQKNLKKLLTNEKRFDIMISVDALVWLNGRAADL